MTNLSFNIRDTKDFLNKLLEDYEEFQKDPTSSRIAINSAMTAWHLSDWAYNEFSGIKTQFPKLDQYQSYLKTLCPQLQIMHDITNGSKHYALTRHNPDVADTNLHEGPFSNAFSIEFDVSTLDIEMKDGTKLIFELELEKVVTFWKGYLEKHIAKG